MQWRRWCGVVANLVSVSLAYGQPALLEELRAHVERTGPRGSIIAEFGMPPPVGDERIVVGYSFESRAWFTIFDGRIRGVDPRARHFVGHEVAGSVHPESLTPGAPEEWLVQMSGAVDKYFPQLTMPFLLRYPEAILSIDRDGAGGFIVVAELPAGRHLQLVRNDPRLSPQRVTYRVDAGGRLRSITKEGDAAERKIAYASDPAPGIHVVSFGGGRQLKAVDASADGRSHLFMPTAVEQRAIEARTGTRSGNLIAEAEQAAIDPPTPLPIPLRPGAGETPPGRIGAAVALAGLLVVLVGGWAWWRQR